MDVEVLEQPRPQYVEACDSARQYRKSENPALRQGARNGYAARHRDPQSSLLLREAHNKQVSTPRRGNAAAMSPRPEGEVVDGLKCRGS